MTTIYGPAKLVSSEIRFLVKSQSWPPELQIFDIVNKVVFILLADLVDRFADAYWLEFLVEANLLTWIFQPADVEVSVANIGPAVL